MLDSCVTKVASPPSDHGHEKRLCRPSFHHIRCNVNRRGVVGSLGYLVNMTRSDLVFAYSELSKYGTFDKSLFFFRD